MSVQVFSHPSCKVILTGASGTGKTTLFEKLIRKSKARWKFVFDHQGEFSQRFGQTACRNIQSLCEATARGGWIIYDPVEMYPGDVETAFLFYADFVFEMSKTFKGHKLFCCDELQMLVTQSTAPVELKTILQTGRRYQLDFFAITNALNAIHNSIRNQTTEIYTFLQSDKNAIAYLAENGFDENQIRNLGQFEYLWRNLRTGENNFPDAAAQAIPEASPSNGSAVDGPKS